MYNLESIAMYLAEAYNIFPLPMAKIHPNKSMIIDTSRKYSSPKREMLTVWMKSLVINGNGCTVYSSEGHVIFRVDNYQTRRSREVLLMSSNGEGLFSVKRQKLRLLLIDSSKLDKEGECFKVRRTCGFFRRAVITCNVTSSCSYKIVGLHGRSTVLKIMDSAGGVLAEVNQKHTLRGVSLGDDVLSLMVEPRIDQSLVVALVIVYAMINNKM